MEVKESETKRPWWKRWWVVLLVATNLAGLIVAVGALYERATVLGSGPPAVEIRPVPTGPPATQGVERELPYRVVVAAFGTDRAAKPDAGKAADTYLSSRGTAVSVGFVRVAVPYRHKIGEIERPSFYRFEFKEDPSKHVVLLSVHPLEPAQFATGLKEVAGQKAFVFVHGYKTSFEDAALRTAQMAVDFGMKLVPAFFSWPSQGALAKYTVDEANAEWTEPHLAQFLEVFADGTVGGEVVVIAHSMGTRAVTRAVSALLTKRADLRPRFRELVLAAPDIDAEVFKRDILPRIVAANQRVTLYASSNDKALKASKGVHGSPRAGESGKSLVVAPGLETIDASGIDTDFLGHSYFAETRPLLTDLELLLTVDLRAERRPTLEARSLNGQPYWAFRR